MNREIKFRAWHKNLKKMYKTAQKMIRSAMLAFLEGKTRKRYLEF